MHQHLPAGLPGAAAQAAAHRSNARLSRSAVLDQYWPVDRSGQCSRARRNPRAGRAGAIAAGANLPAGAKFQVDDGKTSELQIQTCEARGCYANLQISPDVLTALKSGKQLKVSFQNLAKETISIPMPLADFAAAYEKIK